MKILTNTKRGWLVIRDWFLFAVVYLAYSMVWELGIYASGFAMDGVVELLLAQFGAVLALFATYFSLKKVRTLPSSGLGFTIRGRGKDVIGGILVATLLYSFGFGISCFAGWIQVESVQWPWKSMLTTWLLFFLVAVYEETLLRGIVLGKLLDSGMSKLVALVLSSLFFSVLHLLNPHFSCLPFANLFLAGVMLGASYVYTRNLWFPISLHWFWNWLQGPVLGYGVSGIKIDEPALTICFSGPEMLSGSSFGFEGTLLCTILMIIVTGVIIGRCRQIYR